MAMICVANDGPGQKRRFEHGQPTSGRPRLADLQSMRQYFSFAKNRHCPARVEVSI